MKTDFETLNGNGMQETNKTKPVIVGHPSQGSSPSDAKPVVIGGSAFTVIAGPCSIENESLFTEVADSVRNSGAVMLRGGIWKLRTSAKTFQGLGADAISFIREVLKKTNMHLVSEITDPRQIEQIDDLVGMYQVGSRNMHNYALLKELGNSKKPVMIKRGFASYVDEWIKSADYVLQGGNDQVILCERGIRTFETATRNTMDLNAVVYAKAHSPYPVIVDPSHAVGMSEFVPSLAYAAAAAGADGIIVEVHPRPKEALSDGRQALKFDEFDGMMKKIQRILTALDVPMNTLS